MEQYKNLTTEDILIKNHFIIQRYSVYFIGIFRNLMITVYNDTPKGAVYCSYSKSPVVIRFNELTEKQLERLIIEECIDELTDDDKIDIIKKMIL